MYIDKQCAARTHAGDRRVNRSSRKNRWPGRGLSWTAHELKAALATTRKRRQGSTASIGRGHRGSCAKSTRSLRAFPWLRSLNVTTGTPAEGSASASALVHLMAQENGKERFLTPYGNSPKPLRSQYRTKKRSPSARCLIFPDSTDRPSKRVPAIPSREERDHAVGSYFPPIAPGRVVDIFAVAGSREPDLSILSDEILAKFAHATAQPCRRVAPENCERRAGNPTSEKSGTGSLFAAI